MVSQATERDGTLLSVAIGRRLAHFMLDIAFCAPPGRTVLFGPSGAGKSLTLQAIAGLVPLERADIRLGATLWHASETGVFVPPQGRKTGYLPQHYALFPHLTVAQNIAFGQRRRGHVAGKRVAELLALMQLEGQERLYPAQLSGGQQQRVALARALASEPQLLLLDEPWSALDAPVRVVLRAEIQRFYEQVGVPLVLVTHDVQDAQALADTIVIIEQGQVLQTGSPAEVFRAPRTPRVARLVGMDTHWQGVMTALEPASAQEQLATVTVSWLALHALLPMHSRLRVGQTVTAGILPDEIVPLAPGVEWPPESRSQPALVAEATVIQAQARGSFYAVTVYLGADLRLELPVPRWHARDLTLASGSRLRLAIPCAAVHLFEPEEPRI